jgi:hypothetical protein
MMKINFQKLHRHLFNSAKSQKKLKKKMIKLNNLKIKTFQYLEELSSVSFQSSKQTKQI